MSDAGGNVRVIFGEVLDCATPAEQAAYLDRACGGDTALRDRVEKLLRAHQRVGGFLERTSPHDPGPTEAAGTVLGPYQLLEPLGAGGFGIVYRAQQQQPLRRLVALKILRPEMDGRPVIARFEAERQALALMNHPNIARVLDAGEAPPAYPGGSPRPYFVMELVEGVPLTDFCDQERLTPRERLELFTSVCQAVQHAHQKGIIHRDLKPSNVLASRQDGVPLVKVIDFGIAKALDQRLTDKTLLTGEAQVIGTPLYMSPEQAEPGAVDIDTRSDIYSLGLLLYELLTGTTPFDPERLRQASFDELRRIIREEEPPRPSTRISTLGPAAETLSQQRQTDPRQLGQLLRGELDWVVMKCLEKERGRRYETADALARDVARYLADEPVEACPPSAGYRLGKFLRKHRRPLLTAAAFLGLLAVGGVLAGWQAVREARVERDRAVEQARRDGAIRAALDRTRTLREEARQERDAGKLARAREQAQRAQALVESGPTEEALAAQVRQVQEELDEEVDRQLVADLENAYLAQSETVAAKNRFAWERALPRYREAFRVYGMPVGEGDPAAAVARLRQRPLEVRWAVSAALDDWLGLAANRSLQIGEPHLDWLRALAVAELDEGETREARTASQEQDPDPAAADVERLAEAADVPQLPPRALVYLARRLQADQATVSAVQLLRRAWLQHPEDFWVNEDLGNLAEKMEPEGWVEAVRHLTAAVALRPDSPGAQVNLGATLHDQGRLDEAIACFRRAIGLAPSYFIAHLALGMAQQKKGQVDDAIASYRRALELDPEHVGAHNNLGLALYDKGQVDEAIACYHRALKLDPKHTDAHVNLGVALYGKGQVDEAIACYRLALELDPKKANAHVNLGVVLRNKGQLDEAIASYRRALELDPEHVVAHNSLGPALKDKGQLDEAIACFRLAIACFRLASEHAPQYAKVHWNLGVALQAKSQLDEAITCYRRAIDLDPKFVEAHYDLGTVLEDKGQVDEAIACFRRAIELDPKMANAHEKLGAALKIKGQVDEAIACFRRAIELDPKMASAHANLGVVLRKKGQVDEAIACCRRALELDPKSAHAHLTLGNALGDKGQVDEAIACFRRAIELDPKFAEAHCNLGFALRGKGDFRAALAAVRTGHELGTQRPGWSYPSDQWLKQFERCVQLDDLLAAVRQGKARPAGPAECLELADLCRWKQLPATAVRFYTEAFTAEPKRAADLQTGHRYAAAQAAARAGCGQGQDVAGLDAAEQARLRRQALEWLQADLALRAKQLDSGEPADRATAQQILRSWQQDSGLVGIRDPAALDKLPAQEQKAFAQLWSDVAALLAKAADAPKER